MQTSKMIMNVRTDDYGRAVAFWDLDDRLLDGGSAVHIDGRLLTDGSEVLNGVIDVESDDRGSMNNAMEFGLSNDATNDLGIWKLKPGEKKLKLIATTMPRRLNTDLTLELGLNPNVCAVDPNAIDRRECETCGR